MSAPTVTMDENSLVCSKLCSRLKALMKRCSNFLVYVAFIIASSTESVHVEFELKKPKVIAAVQD